jgi:hypothetical protein
MSISAVLAEPTPFTLDERRVEAVAESLGTSSARVREELFSGIDLGRTKSRGLTNMGGGLLGPVRRIIDRRIFRTSAEAVKVVPSQLGDDVGTVGAVAVAMLGVGLA